MDRDASIDWSKISQGHIAIGNNALRKAVSQKVREFCPNFRFPALVHPTASISKTAQLGPGALVMTKAVVHARSRIGEHAIINTASIIEHDCQIQNFVNISPGCALGGEVNVGESTSLGLGTIVRQGLLIGQDSLIGMGSVVTKSIPEGVVAYGNPCRVQRNHLPTDPQF